MKGAGVFLALALLPFAFILVCFFGLLPLAAIVLPGSGSNASLSLDSSASQTAAIGKNGSLAADILNSVNSLYSGNAPGTNGGDLACAWAVNQILTEAGYQQVGGGLDVGSANAALENHVDGAQQVSLQQVMSAPVGSVFIVDAMDPARPDWGYHIGFVVVGANGPLIYSNSSSHRMFMQNYTIQDWYSSFQSYQDGATVNFFSIPPK